MAANTQQLTILAQDPAVRVGGALVLAKVDVPFELIAAGPMGYRVKVVDFDSTTHQLYEPFKYELDESGKVVDPFALPPGKKLTVAERVKFDASLLANPNFHAQHVYAIVMRTLARFEQALGRRVAWGFDGHQLHVAPHAFCEANAFYSEQDRALLFGYFEGKSGKAVFTCLSHDIVAHETTHALLDGLRDRYTDDSGPDQSGFHEGFSDVVALLSVFSLREIVELALVKEAVQIKTQGGVRLLNASNLTEQALAGSILFGLGKEFGQEMEGARANALRRSLNLKPSRRYLEDAKYDEPHDRGEVFAAAVLRSFLRLWLIRIGELGKFNERYCNLDMVIDEGAKIADHLLTIAIRALDYCPPVDFEFGDFLAALLTVDREVVPDDSRFSYRIVIRAVFDEYGIAPPATEIDKDGCWKSFVPEREIIYSKTNFESMLRDKEEVFRFVWENRFELEIDERAYTQVISVRPSTRFGPDGFLLRETVCEYVQILDLFGAECKSALGFERPPGMPTTQRFRAYGGSTLVFDQYGRIKYSIRRRLDDVNRQSRRLTFLWENGFLENAASMKAPFASIHSVRASNTDGE